MDDTRKSRLITRRGRLAAVKSSAVVMETDIDYYVRWVTPSIEPMLGWPAASLIGTPIIELFHPDDRKSLSSESAEQSLLLRVLRKDRAYHWMKGFSSPLADESNATVGWIFSLQDVDELVSRRRLLSTVLANVDAHIYMKGLDRRYLYANPHVQELMGRPLEQIIGHTDDELLPPETVAAVKEFDGEVFRTGGLICREETIPDTSGRPRIFLSKKMLMHQPDQPDCLIGFSTEITELKRAEVSLRNSAKQLAEAQQRYLAMMENYPGVVVETDRHGTITVMSPSITAVTGWNPEQCIGQPLEHFIEAVDRPTLRSLLASCFQGATGQALLHIHTNEGDPRSISMLMHPTYAVDGSIIGTSGWWREAVAA